MTAAAFDAAVRVFTDTKAIEGIGVVLQPDDESTHCTLSECVHRSRMRKTFEESMEGKVSAPHVPVVCELHAPAAL